MGKDQDHFVYTVTDGKAHKALVTVGVDDGKMAEITAGLRPGARVRWRGAEKIRKNHGIILFKSERNVSLKDSRSRRAT